MGGQKSFVSLGCLLHECPYSEECLHLQLRRRLYSMTIRDEIFIHEYDVNRREMVSF